jgi:hypothetical protein
MGVQLLVSLRRNAFRPEADPRAARLQSVLAAANRTGLYTFRFENLSGAPNPFEILTDIPPASLQTVVENLDQFANSRAHPSDSRIKIKGVHLLPDGWRRKLGLTAETIAGPQADLAKLAARIDAGEPASGRGARRLLVYTRLGEPLLAPELRDRLWRAFELPVFEQLRGFEGELLATECEAHEGMHLESESGIFEVLDGELVVTSLLALRHPILRLRTGLAGAMGRRTCPCGETISSFLPDASGKPPAFVNPLPAVARAGASS